MASRSKRQRDEDTQVDESVSLYFDACRRKNGHEMEKCFDALVSSREPCVELAGIMRYEDIERCRKRIQKISEDRKLILFRFFCIAEALHKRITYEDAKSLDNAGVAFERFSRVIDLPEDGNCRTRFFSFWLTQFFGTETIPLAFLSHQRRLHRSAGGEK